MTNPLPKWTTSPPQFHSWTRLRTISSTSALNHYIRACSTPPARVVVVLHCFTDLSGSGTLPSHTESRACYVTALSNRQQAGQAADQSGEGWRRVVYRCTVFWRHHEAERGESGAWQQPKSRELYWPLLQLELERTIWKQLIFLIHFLSIMCDCRGRCIQNTKT